MTTFLSDAQGVVLAEGDRVAFAVGVGRASGRLTIGVITLLNEDTDSVRITYKMPSGTHTIVKRAHQVAWLVPEGELPVNPRGLR